MSNSHDPIHIASCPTTPSSELAGPAEPPPGACSGPLPPDGGHSPARPSSSAVAEGAPEPVAGLSATYSPEDNKLRLYSLTRLPRDLYERVHAAGFTWAAKQELFVAPKWTPEREDLLIELCGEIDDEDRSLVERAEELADRFEGYRENRTADAAAARTAVDRITDGIPLGQPILVGHHSEKRARKDAERIENGMRRAIRMWDTAEYWKRRAAGAIRAAKYKERVDVRHRRIRGLEAELRKEQKTAQRAEDFAKVWSKPGLTTEKAKAIANYDHVYLRPGPGENFGDSLWSALDRGMITADEAAARALEVHSATTARTRRWADHLNNRLAYERTMLEDAGGLPADKFEIEIGGRALVKRWGRQGWHVVTRVVRKDGRILSVRTTDGLVGIEDVADYKPPQGDDAAKVKAATKLPPLCNYRTAGCIEMTKAEYDRTARAQMACTRIREANGDHGRHRLRNAMKGGFTGMAWVFITDAKEVPPPASSALDGPKLPAPEPVAPGPARVPASSSPGAAETEALRSQLRAGVKVVTAPQLFPAPARLAARMVALAQIEDGHTVLEPSAGTGSLLRAIGAAADLVAVEVNLALADQLRSSFPDLQIRRADFLECSAAELGTFDRVLMNPPFAQVQDVEHILHALSMLRPGGRLVAICADGPRQSVTLRPLVEACGGRWEELPAGTFEGTQARAILLTMHAEVGGVSGTGLGRACVRDLASVGEGGC
jgi:phospholipid N-methyltransferase